jgi:hypothetical protein
MMERGRAMAKAAALCWGKAVNCSDYWTKSIPPLRPLLLLLFLNRFPFLYQFLQILVRPQRLRPSRRLVPSPQLGRGDDDIDAVVAVVVDQNEYVDNIQEFCQPSLLLDLDFSLCQRNFHLLHHSFLRSN